MKSTWRNTDRVMLLAGAISGDVQIEKHVNQTRIIDNWIKIEYMAQHSQKRTSKIKLQRDFFEV